MEAVEVRGAEQVLTDEALAFVEDLHSRFEPRRQELLRARAERSQRLADEVQGRARLSPVPSLRAAGRAARSAGCMRRSSPVGANRRRRGSGCRRRY